MGKKIAQPLLPVYGGLSSDEKIGPKYSFARGRSLDFRKSPSKLTILPGPAKDSGSTVTDLITAGVRVANGDNYFLGDAGNLWKRTAAGTWSNIGDVGNSGHGLVYRRDTDSLYITKDTEVARYFPVSNSPSLSNSKYATSVDQSLTGGASTFNLATSIAETSNDRQFFTPTIEPLYSVKLYVAAKGTTADWTVTVHDDANNVIGTSTVVNASLTNGQLNEFVLATAGRMLVKPNARTYHIHVTASNTTGAPQARVTTLNNFDTADFETYAPRLIVPNNGLHPIALFQQYVVTGNERYLSVWEPLQDTPSNAEWQRHRLTFPPGYEVTSLAVHDEFLAIGCEQLTSTSEDMGGGKIFFWDGTATTYNFFIDVREGSPYGLFTHQNVLYYIAGGALYAYAGGQPIKVRQFPNTDSEYSTYDKFSINYPQTMTVRNGVLLIAFPTLTQNQNIEHGVYSFGQRDKDYSQSFGFSYPISTGTLLNTGSNNLRVGMVANWDPKLFISWRDGANYGVDLVNVSTAPAASSILETLIFDAGRSDKEKLAVELVVTFKTLPTSAVITPKYKIDRTTNYTNGDDTGTVGESVLRMPINLRFREIQLGLDITSGATTPEITGAFLIYDPLESEAD